MKINLGIVTTIIILTCLVAFIIELADPSLLDYSSFSYSNFITYPWVLLTSSFLHAGLMHLGYNLFALVMLGYGLELKTGPKFMIMLYLTSTITGNTAFALLFPRASAVGISGFIYGVIGALIIIRPKMRILVPGFITPIPVWLGGPLMGLGEFLLSFTLADGIAHIAHLGGLAAGLVLGFIGKVKIRPEH